MSGKVEEGISLIRTVMDQLLQEQSIYGAWGDYGLGRHMPITVKRYTWGGFKEFMVKRGSYLFLEGRIIWL